MTNSSGRMSFLVRVKFVTFSNALMSKLQSTNVDFVILDG